MTAQTRKADPFYSADFYSIYDDAEELNHTTVEEAFWESMSHADGGPTTIYAWKRAPVSEEWIASEAIRLAESLSEDYEDEYGGGNDPMIDDKALDRLGRAMRKIIEETISKCPAWQCSVISKKVYSQEEIAKIIGK